MRRGAVLAEATLASCLVSLSVVPGRGDVKEYPEFLGVRWLTFSGADEFGNGLLTRRSGVRAAAISRLMTSSPESFTIEEVVGLDEVAQRWKLDRARASRRL